MCRSIHSLALVVLNIQRRETKAAQCSCVSSVGLLVCLFGVAADAGVDDDARDFGRRSKPIDGEATEEERSTPTRESVPFLIMIV